MKYHTTISNLVHALAILFVVVVSVLIAGMYLSMPDPGQAVSDLLVERLGGFGEHVLTIGRIDSSLFSKVTVHDASLKDAGGSEMFHADRITIDVPAYRFAWSVLFPKQMGVEIAGLHVYVDSRSVSLLGSFAPEKDRGGPGLPDSIQVRFSDSSLSYRMDGVEADMEGIGGVVRFMGGSLSQASVSTGGIGAAQGETWSAAADSSLLEFGPSTTGAFGARIQIAAPSIEMNRGELAFGAGSATLALFGDSLSSMAGLNGTLVVQAQSVHGQFPLDTDHGAFTLDRVGVQGILLAGSMGRGEATVGLLGFGYGDWEASLASSQWWLESAGPDHSLRFSSTDRLSVSYRDAYALSVDLPEATIEQNGAIDTLRVGANTLAVPSFASLSSLFGIELPAVDSIELHDAHLLAVRNVENGHSNIESSFSLRSETDFPFLAAITADVSGDMELDDNLTIRSARSSIRNLAGTDVPGTLSADAAYDGSTVELLLDYPEGIQATVDYDIPKETGRLSWRFNAFSPYAIRHIIDTFSPTIGAILVPETTIEGNINLQSTLDGSAGRGTAEVGIANLAVDESRFNIATTLNGSMDEQSYRIDLATLTTEGYRLSFMGAIDRVGLIPDGTVNISEVNSGEEIVSADFEREASQVYRYRITSPKTPGSSLDGMISWAEENLLTADATLTIPRMQYPVNVRFSVPEGMITLESDNLSAAVDFLREPGHVSLALNMNALPLPQAVGTSLTGYPVVSGSIDADVSLADGLYLVQADALSIDGLAWNASLPWSLRFSFDADPGQLRIADIAYADARGTLTGSFEMENRSLQELIRGRLDGFSTRLQVAGTDGSFVGAAFFPDGQDASVARGSLSISRFDLGRFGLLGSFVPLDMQLVGETDLDRLANAHADVRLEIDGNASASAKIHLEEDGLLVEEASYESEKASMWIEHAQSLFSGSTEVLARLSTPSAMTWRDGSSRIVVNATTDLGPSDSVFDWVSRWTGDLPPITVAHRDVRLFGDIPWQSGTHELLIRDDRITVSPLEGGTLSLSYDLRDGNLSLDASEGFPVPMQVSGHLSRDGVSLDVERISFDMRHLNSLFLEPIITFDSGMVSGSLLIEGPLDDPDYFGTLMADSVELGTFWTVGELFSIKNPVITVSENLATVAPTPVSAVHKSGRSTTAVVQLEASLERWNVPHYRIDILGIDAPISFWLPLYTLGINVDSMAQGTFSIDGTPTEETLYGDITVSDALINFGVSDPPPWFTEKTRTSIDMTLRTGRNVSFIYPNEDAPILRATFADDQAIGIVVEAPSMVTSFSGGLAFRSGEIYYVQKNFYITEGSLKFPAIGGEFANAQPPTLSLRARLREFDTDGTRVDIYMVLQDSRFDDLNPRFESIPLRSTNEILELLGQNIVAPGTVGESGLESVVSVATAATDVFSRLGILQNTTISLGFSNIIRDSLGLDVFTIRSNLLQNIIFDALPGIAADTSVSPLARYLDNTTMYIGKYILDDFYMQGMLHFRQDGMSRGTSFLANDLRIDTELSVEWTNPLATFSLFTQPEELSVFDLFDTMGFSITKRFDL